MKTISTILALVWMVVGQLMSHAASPAVYVLDVEPGANLAQIIRDLPAENVHLRLKGGEFVVTPSVVLSNRLGALNLFNKTNWTIEGVPGQTRLNGRSALGELIYVTNSANIRLAGLTLEGRVETNTVLVASWNIVWGGLSVYNVSAFTVDNCRLIDHHDHGILGMASQPNYNTPSTNNIRILNSYFENCGSARTNEAVVIDGTAIVPDGPWWIEGCEFRNNLRDIEPYSEGDSAPNMTFGVVIANNRFFNTIENSISPAGSTNLNNVSIYGNYFEREVGFTRRSSNIISSASFIYWNGGSGWKIFNNEFRGQTYAGVWMWGVRDGVITYNRGYDLTNSLAPGGIGVQSETAYNCIIANNDFRRTERQSIYLYGLRDSKVTDNTVIDPAGEVGIQLATFSDNTASNITIARNWIVGATNAIFDQLGGTFKIRLLDNYIEGATARYNNSSGDEWQISGPLQVFNYTNDFPSIAAGGSFRTNFPALGVRTNDYATVMVPDQFYRIGTNIVVNAWASNDVVWLYLHNAGPASADVGNVRFKAAVRQVEAY